MKKEIISQIEKFLNDYLKTIDYELVEIKNFKEHGQNILRIYVFSFNGVDLDMCVEISRILDDFIEENKLIESAYNLEISSPGIDRPIKNNDDLRRNISKILELKLYSKINGLKDYVGTLSAYTDETITITVNGEDVIFDRNNIASLKQAIIF